MSGGLTCDSAASCDSDRRIHTSKSHNASISHVIWLFRANFVPARSGLQYLSLASGALAPEAPEAKDEHCKPLAATTKFARKSQITCEIDALCDFDV